MLVSWSPVNRSDLFVYTRLRRRLDRTKVVEPSLEGLKVSEDRVAEDGLGHDFDHHIETGFQLATFQGPLCSEPVEGMAYILESLEVASEETKSETGGVSALSRSLYAVEKSGD